MAKKQYENFTVFGARIYGMKNLWNPSTEYKGQPTTRPNYIAGFIAPKTRAHWSEEPIFAGVWGAMQKIYAGVMNGMPYNMVDWPIRDGDIPMPGQKPAEWARGHWMFSGNSGDPIGVEIVQNGVPVKLLNRATVKPGDYVAVGGATAVKSNDARGIKFYINSVLFMGPGEEIAVGNSVSGAELMAQAHAQGLQVTGFAPGGGGFGAPGGGGFHQQGGFPGGPQPQGNFAPAPGQFAPQGGQPFTAPGAPGFTPPPGPGGFAPTGPAGPAMQVAPGQFAAPGVGFGGPGQMAPGAPGQYPQGPTNGNAAFPSNPGQPFPGAPQGGGWPQR